MAKKLWFFLLALVALIVVTLLYGQSRIADPEIHQRSVENLRLFAQLDATLNQDILRSRYRLLRHYDPLVATLEQMRSLQSDLKHGPMRMYHSDAPDVENAIAAVDQSLEEKEGLVEQFKSHNAILQNSIRYLPLAGENLIRDANLQKRQDIAELSGRILRIILFYTVMPSEELIAQAQPLLDALNKEADAYAPLSSDINHVAAHISLIFKQRLIVDGLVTRLMATPTTSNSKALLRAHNLLYENRVERARFFQVVLFGIAVLLVAYGTFLTIKQTKTAISLRKTVNDLNNQQLALDQHSIVSIVSPNRIIISANDRLCAITGHAREQLVGKDSVMLGADIEDVWREVSMGVVWHGEIHNLNKDGNNYWLDATIVPFKDEKGRIYQYVVVATDVTARKRAVEALRHNQEQLEKLVEQRTAELLATNKELESFAYSVSHDLRAPLRAIDGFSLALFEDYGNSIDAQGLDYLQRVRAATQHMGHLIDDILALSRVTRQEMSAREVDLSHIAQEIANELQVREPERQVTFVIAPNVRVSGDERLLRIVMDNLIGNAWKYTSKHPLARIEFATTTQNGETVYFVRDDGSGFDMQYVGKLFTAFQRLHKAEEFPGTGVGLTTAAHIIHRHEGRIWAEAEVEHGATFFFTCGLAIEAKNVS